MKFRKESVHFERQVLGEQNLSERLVIQEKDYVTKASRESPQPILLQSEKVTWPFRNVR